MESIWKLWKKYIRQHRQTALTLLLFAGIFWGIFSLYQLEAEAVIYALFLCVLAGCCILGAHFIFWYRKHRKLTEVRENPELLLSGLQEADIPAADYLSIAEKILEDYRKSATEWQTERRDMMDYFTVWVHQIKTPIAAMKLTLQQEDTPESRKLLADLFRVEQYVELVLVYFRLESTHTDYVFRRYDLDEIIRQAVRKYAHEFVQKKLTLEFVPTGRQILTDEKWLSFIIEQLLSNAVKYTRTGGVTISMEGDCLQIRDTGIGIAPEDIPRVFENGFTGYNGRADKKATGLGLYLCKQTAEKLSCRLWIDSKVGEGTTVFLELKERKTEVE